ncbi:Prefoldin subunit-domain-containing protein [Talaromyces proteolyticus]|uniref:Prefoldin subunit-domain-containing protein n=1 Tax=Talaromyces proteolyticus TaxID=1131652 RepID=A0AAD4KUG8_9EURO|nr:Prefoldin subunit-domain-containing protein [Talaromyces proteolyticus]KAH8700240.1 Prefoldin subunit-domain-containing protein [Talaromyces proteolyticus]
MAAAKDSLAGIERQRLELEENVRKLRQSLYDWRIREAEYDELKEGVESLGQDCTKDDILQLGKHFEGIVVDEKEVKALVGEYTAIVRSRDHVIQQISRRLDYVKQNISTLERRLESVEANLDKILSVERPGPNAAEERYAVTEIFEELDEDGNVISSKLSAPGDRTPDIIEVLKKAGVEVPQDSKDKQASTVDQIEEVNNQQKDQASQIRDTMNSEPAESKVVHDTVDSKNIESDDSDPESPIAEVDEPVEDARLRREMLEYSFHEVGKVVAELEMDEEGSDFSYDDNDYDDDELGDEEEDEHGRTTTRVLSEEYHQQMKELQKKLEAGGFVNLGPAKNPPAETIEANEKPSNMKAVSVKKEDNDETKPAPKKVKKKVAFANELDIAHEPTPIPPPPKAERKIEPVKPETTPLSESVVERKSSKSEANGTSAPSGTAPKKTSRFKSARNGGFPTPGDSSSLGLGMKPSTVKRTDIPSTPSPLPLFPATPKEPKPFSQPIVANDIFANPTPTMRGEPRPPEGKTLADNLVERPAINKDNILPPEPDDIDEDIHRKEVASEFYRLRNRKIQQKGGFLNEDDGNELYELDENDQPKKRVSKFKAARVRP